MFHFELISELKNKFSLVFPRLIINLQNLCTGKNVIKLFYGSLYSAAKCFKVATLVICIMCFVNLFKLNLYNLFLSNFWFKSFYLCWLYVLLWKIPLLCSSTVLAFWSSWFRKKKYLNGVAFCVQVNDLFWDVIISNPKPSGCLFVIY